MQNVKKRRFSLIELLEPLQSLQFWPDFCCPL